jgi:ribonuclease P/MRP protein subunit POP5
LLKEEIKIVNKERQRYIFFRIFTENELSFDQNYLLRTIWQSIWRYFGMKEANKIGLWLTEVNLEKGYGIIRCSHHTKEIIISALALIKEINGKKVILSPVKTSGTISSIKKKLKFNIPD